MMLHNFSINFDPQGLFVYHSNTFRGDCGYTYHPTLHFQENNIHHSKQILQ